jgi:hypothetical protein
MRSVDKVIQILREMMVANAPGTGGGFSTGSSAEGPVAGKDKPLSKKRFIYARNTRRNWLPKKTEK